MYEPYFEFERRPFSTVPSVDSYFPSAKMESARSSLVRLIDRHEGPGLVIGPVGSGKTLLCQLLANHFRDQCRLSVLTGGRLCTRRALLQAILFELELPFRDMDENELRLSLVQHVTSADACPTGLLLLVDEADNMTMSLLDELRSMTNIFVDDRSCIRLVLFGNTQLEERFSHPRLESFNQRLAGRFYIEPLAHDETVQYVRQQFVDCGGDPDRVMATDTYQAIYTASGGVPRIINQICDHALILAMAGGIRQLNAAAIDEAWADLQQLPSPSEMKLNDITARREEPVIEFGQLDGDSYDDHQLQAATDAKLDQVEDGIVEVSSDPATPLPEPAIANRIVSAPPEVQLFLHSAHDPFNEEFAEEEVVIDQFISPHVIAGSDHQRVSCEEGRQIAAQLDQMLRETSCAVDDPHSDSTGQSPETGDRQANESSAPGDESNSRGTHDPQADIDPGYESSETEPTEDDQPQVPAEVHEIENQVQQDVVYYLTDQRNDPSAVATVETTRKATRGSQLTQIQQSHLDPSERAEKIPVAKSQENRSKYRRLFTRLRQNIG